MEQRALVRSKNNKMLAGVLGGFADRYGWDVTWLRPCNALQLSLQYLP